MAAIHKNLSTVDANGADDFRFNTHKGEKYDSDRPEHQPKVYETDEKVRSGSGESERGEALIFEGGAIVVEQEVLAVVDDPIHQVTPTIPVDAERGFEKIGPSDDFNLGSIKVPTQPWSSLETTSLLNTPSNAWPPVPGSASSPTTSMGTGYHRVGACTTRQPDADGIGAFIPFDGLHFSKTESNESVLFDSETALHHLQEPPVPYEGDDISSALVSTTATTTSIDLDPLTSAGLISKVDAEDLDIASSVPLQRPQVIDHAADTTSLASTPTPSPGGALAIVEGGSSVVEIAPTPALSTSDKPTASVSAGTSVTAQPKSPSPSAQRSDPLRSLKLDGLELGDITPLQESPTGPSPVLGSQSELQGGTPAFLQRDQGVANSVHGGHKVIVPLEVEPSARPSLARAAPTAGSRSSLQFDDFLQSRQEQPDDNAAPADSQTATASSAISITSFASATSAASSSLNISGVSGAFSNGSSRSPTGSTTSRISIPPNAPAGAIIMTQPPETVGTSFYKIFPTGNSDRPNLITFGWNFTDVIVQPTSLTVQAACENGYTYGVGGVLDANSTASDASSANEAAYTGNGIIPASQSQVVWDVYGYQTANPETPLPQGLCTLKINDERGFGAARKAGYLAPNDALTFALYTGEAYTPLASGWRCTACTANAGGRVAPLGLPIPNFSLGTPALGIPALLSLCVAVVACLLSMLYVWQVSRHSSAVGTANRRAQKERAKKLREERAKLQTKAVAVSGISLVRSHTSAMNTGLSTPERTERKDLSDDVVRGARGESSSCEEDQISSGRGNPFARKAQQAYSSASRCFESDSDENDLEIVEDDNDDDEKEADKVEDDLLMLWDVDSERL